MIHSNALGEEDVVKEVGGLRGGQMSMSCGMFPDIALSLIR